MTSLPLDPRKSPWKRGDVCTSGFKTNGFVTNATPECLEVLWMPEHTVEQVPAGQMDDLLRVAHADSLSAGNTQTNLEVLAVIESLDRIQVAITDRAAGCKSEREKEELNVLIRRSFAKDGCAWDRAHAADLFALAVEPHNVGIVFRLQDRAHRLFRKRHGQ
jgi:hypothetical protein